jgi:hypothetical protein
LVPYRAMLDVPHEVVEYVSWLIYARRCELNSRWRRLGCFEQALLALVHLRKNETLAHLGAGFAVSTATAGRYVKFPQGRVVNGFPLLSRGFEQVRGSQSNGALVALRVVQDSRQESSVGSVLCTTDSGPGPGRACRRGAGPVRARPSG